MKKIISLGLKIFLYFSYILAISFFAFVTLKSVIIYRFIVNEDIVYLKGVVKSDAIYGLSAIPNAIGAIYFPGGDSIPVSIDENGFRTVTYQTKESHTYSGKILFIGDSFTFGDANYMEDSYPYLVAEKLNLELANASMVGYGYVQQQLRINSLIESTNPDIVAIQLSPVSAERSISGNLPAFIKIPAPFYYYDESDSTLIHSPLYETRIFDNSQKRELSKYFGKEGSISLLVDFIFNLGFPAISHQLINDIFSIPKLLKVKKLQFTEEAETAFLTFLNKEFKERNIQVVFFNVGFNPHEFENKIKEFNNIIDFKALFINSESTLWENVEDEEGYYMKYGHWRGEPGRLVDKHYNKLANKLVAKMLADSIRQTCFNVQD